MDVEGAGRPAPRFSILLPTHNRADVLPFAIRSVLDQTVRDFELLIVGDGCTDGTAGVVAGFADPRIRWFNLPKAPHFGYANRNVALRQARGDLIAYMAHDDLWLPDHLELLGRHFDSVAIAIVYSRALWVAPDGLITPTTVNFHDRATLDQFLRRQENHIPSSCFIHRGTCFADYGYWDETLPGSGDWDMWARIIAGGGGRNVAYEPTPTCLHFRASWRTEANAGPSELATWKALRARGLLPPTLPAVPIELGQPEQATTWRSLAAAPAAWTLALRMAVQLGLDLCAALAHHALDLEDKDRQIGNLDRSIDQHELALADKDRHIGALEAALSGQDQALAHASRAADDLSRQLAHLGRALSASEQARDDRERQVAELGAALTRQRQHADQRTTAL